MFLFASEQKSSYSRLWKNEIQSFSLTTAEVRGLECFAIHEPLIYCHKCYQTSWHSSYTCVCALSPKLATSVKFSATPVPEHWISSTFVPFTSLFKNGDPTVCANYRTICLISPSSK